MLFALDTLIVAGLGVAVPSLVFWSSYRSAVNAGQRRLYRQAFLVGIMLAAFVSVIAWGSAKGQVPLWLAAIVVGLWCLSLLPALAWLRRELAVRAREPYADMFR